MKSGKDGWLFEPPPPQSLQPSELELLAFRLWIVDIQIWVSFDIMFALVFLEYWELVLCNWSLRSEKLLHHLVFFSFCFSSDILSGFHKQSLYDVWSFEVSRSSTEINEPYKAFTYVLLFRLCRRPHMSFFTHPSTSPPFKHPYTSAMWAYLFQPSHLIRLSLHKKWSFPLRISSVNVTKCAVSCGMGHIYWRNP